MPQALRHTLLSVRDLLVTAGPFLLLTVLLLGLAYLVLDPDPPRRVVLATGGAQGAYAEFGKRYADLLKAYGVTVELRPTAGSSENLHLLRDPASGVDVAFVQGGADRQARVERQAATLDGSPARDSGELVSLGSLFYEPIWIFYRADAATRLLHHDTLDSLTQLPGWRVNIGEDGSGAAVLMNKLLEANRLDPAAVTLLQGPQTQAVVDLIEGRLDALVFVSAPESLMVQMLLQTPGVKLFDFVQSEAYARRFPFMSTVVLPRGIVDLARDEPSADVHLIAPTAVLVAKADMHPALMQLFVQAAKTVHGRTGWFQRRGDFPNAQHSELALSKEAQRFYQNGPPFLQRYLPFWFANLIDRMWPVLLSIVAVLIPLSRLVPPVYELRVRSRIFRWYGRLREIEASLARPGAEPARDGERLLAQLNELDDRVVRIPVPLSHADELYALRGHIDLVRKRLAGDAGGGSPAEHPLSAS